MESSIATTPPPVPEVEERGPHLSRRDKVLALAGTLTALMMAGLDQTIVATAGPEIQRDLQIPAALYAWITTAYLVASTVMLPIYGKLSDLYGRKPILITGVGLFLLGSLLCGLAHTTGFLIAARLVQGLGAASLFTTTLAVIADLFPPNERGKYMGLIGMVMGISSILGPIAGGLITDHLGWHWVFFINLPVGALALWLIVTHMPRLGGRSGSAVKIDYAGAFWLVAAVVPMMVALSLGSTGEGAGHGWRSPLVVGLLVGAGVAALIFLAVERRVEDPILDLRLFSRNRAVRMATLTMFVLGATFLFTVIFLPLLFVNAMGISASSAGLSLMPLTMCMVVSSVVSGQIASRSGHLKSLLVGALLVLLGGFAFMHATLADPTYGGVIVATLLIGLGTGPTLPLYTLLVQNASPPNQLGVVTSGSIFARSVGQVIGLALFGTLFAATLTGSLQKRTSEVMQGLSGEIQPVVAAAIPDISAGGEGTAIAFEGETVRAQIVGASGLSASDRESALTAVAQIEEAFADSLADAIAWLYLGGLVLVAVALVLTMLIPTEPGDKRLRAVRT